MVCIAGDAQHQPHDFFDRSGRCDRDFLELLDELGYNIEISEENGDRTYDVQPPEDRKAVFVGDLVDRGPNTPDVLRLVMNMVEAERAICLPGNHDLDEPMRTTLGAANQRCIDTPYWRLLLLDFLQCRDAWCRFSAFSMIAAFP